MHQRSVPHQELQSLLLDGKHLVIALVDKELHNLGLPLWSDSQLQRQGGGFKGFSSVLCRASRITGNARERGLERSIMQPFNKACSSVEALDRWLRLVWGMLCISCTLMWILRCRALHCPLWLLCWDRPLHTQRPWPKDCVLGALQCQSCNCRCSKKSFWHRWGPINCDFALGH